MPGREQCLPLAVASLASQVDELLLALNPGAVAPSAVSSRNVHIVNTKSDDRAKFTSAQGCEDVFLTADDDIIYPNGYAHRLAQFAFEHPGVPVGFHGSVLTPRWDDYYAEGARTIIRYFADCGKDTEVDVIGTGTMAFVPTAIGFDMDWLASPGLTDLEFSAALRERGIRPRVLAHPGGWIRPVPGRLRGQSISSESRNRTAGVLDVREAARFIVRSRFL